MIGAAALLVVGAHLASVHSEPGFNNVNPGAYVRAGSVAGGAYLNSHKKLSLWAGLTYETPRAAVGPVNVRGAVTGGLVTGYPRADVLPMVTGGIVADAGGREAVRLTFIPNPLPKGAHALHLSWERSF